MKLIIVLTLLCSMAFPQTGIVNEAKEKRAKEYHEALVLKAKELLAKKAELEAELAVVDRKLERFDAGEDVKVEETVTSGNIVSFSTTCGSCFSVPAWACSSGGACYVMH